MVWSSVNAASKLVGASPGSTGVDSDLRGNAIHRTGQVTLVQTDRQGVTRGYGMGVVEDVTAGLNDGVAAPESGLRAERAEAAAEIGDSAAALHELLVDRLAGTSLEVA